jgi:predicted O-methyltransferase YrrM
MSTQTLNLTPPVYDYLLHHSLRESPILHQLRIETAKLSGAVMQISPEQGQFMALLIELLQAKKTLDIGTFTGYSALVVALALPKDGEVIACDVDAKVTDIAKRFWTQAGMAGKIKLHLAPAQETLDQLLAANQQNTFDFAFIDADKNGYPTYYEKSLALVRQGGLIAIDNVLWGGRVADGKDQDKSTQSIRALNEKILKDERVTISMVPTGDGLTLARKR